MNSYLINTDPLIMDVPQGFAFRSDKSPPARKDIDTFYFPKEIASDIGMSKQRIAFLKNKGCPFYGRKTTIRWVRDFLKTSASASLTGVS